MRKMTLQQRQKRRLQQEIHRGPGGRRMSMTDEKKTDTAGEIVIRPLVENEIPAALDLARKVFAEYESPDYSPEGTEEFYRSLRDEQYLAGIRYYGAFDGEKLIGEVGIRPERGHICAFFVDGAYHRRGIGTKLFRRLREDFPGRITLNSSPYGLLFYQALGFAAADTEQTVNGIRFTPMAFGERVPDKTEEDNRALIAFWDKAFSAGEDGEEEAGEPDPDSWKEMAPSAKLFAAAAGLGQKKRVLDYGCGSGWAAVIAAKSGCMDVTAVDPAPGAAKAAGLCAEAFGVQDRVRTAPVAPEWLNTVRNGLYDGIICSNVLDVIPPETAEAVIRELARIAAPDASVIIGLNYYLSPEAAAARGLELVGGDRLYVDGVLRLVSHSDEEWAEIFAPYFSVEKLENFAWPGEAKETRRLFWLKKKKPSP